MKKNGLVKIVSLTVAILLTLSIMAGCTEDKDPNPSTNVTTEATSTEATSSDIPQTYTDMLGSVSDTSDLPDWDGKQLVLKEWYAEGLGKTEHAVAENDVVSPEAKRVTGVSIDVENSYDNGGNDINTKMWLLSAANDWPDMIYTSQTSDIIELVDAEKLYDLSDLLLEYCPDILDKFDCNKYPQILKNIAGSDGNIYFVPAQANNTLIGKLAREREDFDPVNWSHVQMPSPNNGWPRIWVRDDILKKMYPNAKTQDEIEALYLQNGSFSEEEVFDIPIKSSDDFINFLVDMKALIESEEIQENNKPVEVTYAAIGGDNWPLMACLIPQVYGIPSPANYFTYFDKLTGKLEYMFAQDWFKGYVKEFQQLVTEGVVSKESLIDNGVSFGEKLNSGMYAVTYGWNKPDESVLRENGKTYRYRQLWPDIEYNYNQFANVGTAPQNSMKIGIFKDAVAEEDLPQILSYLNYMISDIGVKLVSWGPRSADLWTEENGARVYSNKALEDNMVYRVDNQENIKYNLYNVSLPLRSAFPLYPLATDGDWNSSNYIYSDRVKTAGEADQYFQPGIFDGNSSEEHVVPGQNDGNVWSFAEQWNEISKGRDAFEKALTNPLAARDDAQFEELWKEMLDTAVEVGLDDATLSDMNEIYFEANPNIIKDAAKVNN